MRRRRRQTRTRTRIRTGMLVAAVPIAVVTMMVVVTTVAALPVVMRHVINRSSLSTGSAQSLGGGRDSGRGLEGRLGAGFEGTTGTFGASMTTNLHSRVRGGIWFPAATNNFALVLNRCTGAKGGIVFMLHRTDGVLAVRHGSARSQRGRSGRGGCGGRAAVRISFAGNRGTGQRCCLRAGDGASPIVMISNEGSWRSGE